MSGTSVRDAVEEALTGLVDDAALFPPASLPMADALAGHARHRAGPWAWMVGRFLVTASRLPELEAAADDVDALELGVICDRVGDGGLAETLAADVARARASAMEVTALEISVAREPDPAAAVGTVHPVLREVLGEVPGEALGESDLPPGVDVHLEVPLAGASPQRTRETIAALAAAGVPDGVDRVAVKLRCGGVVAEAHPDAHDLAAALVACAQHRLPVKATAGLHHPHRHTEPDTGFEQHGFYNLLAAVATAWRGAEVDEVAAVLEIRDPDRLRLDRDGLHLDDRTLDPGRLAEVRETGYLGQGSCSIDEPVADLVALGVLAEEHS